ncbi:MAG: MarR family transcriptional regulator [Actinomycetota bacterium]|nr:MarR family transcriptional regulator [Actinomycetota bacterium]
MSDPVDKEIVDAVARLRLVVRALNRRAQAETGPGSPTRTEQAVLAWLDDRGVLTASVLASLEQIRPQSMAQTIDAVERRGWVERSADPDDRRQALITLTEAGRIALDRGRRLRQAWILEAIRTRLDAQEQHALIAAIGLLERMVFD